MGIRRFALVVAIVVAIVVTSCGNSEESKPPARSSDGANGTVVDQPGVTDNEIRVGSVASVTNPLGLRAAALFDGVKAYFAMANARGGVHGRMLRLVTERDDQSLQNQSEVQALLEQDNVFAAVVGTIMFTGADILATAGVPTFGWNINPEWQNGPSLFGDKGSFFGFTRAYPLVPWLARRIDATKIGIVAYSVPQSIDCAKGDQASFERFGAAKVAVVDTSLPFGVTDLSADVAEMKQKGVDLVLTCIDQNGAASLAREMRKQGLRARLYLPNAYDQEFIAKFGDLFEGSYVLTQFTPFELAVQPPGLQRFSTWMQKSGKDRSEIALAGWISADMLVAGLRAAGGNFTRQRVVDALNRMTDYDADGILPGIDWTIAHRDDSPQICYLLLEVVHRKLVPRFGESGKPFICFDRDAQRLPDEPLRRA